MRAARRARSARRAFRADAPDARRRPPPEMTQPRFKAPTLRNIAVTAPYMHDGSIASLDEVIDHYSAGGRTIAGGPHRRAGRDNPSKSQVVRGFVLSRDQRRDLIAFLETLTDDELLHNPSFSNPWTPAHKEAR